MNWNDKTAKVLKAELVRAGISHKELSERLRLIGVNATKSGIDSKLSRGTFSAVFLLQCLCAIGCTELVIPKRP